MTLKEFREYVLKILEDSGVSYTEFFLRSERHPAFFQKLNKIGARNFTTHPPEEYPDIDATVILTPAEEESLRSEFYSLSLNTTSDNIN